jgi:hypothetical protein
MTFGLVATLLLAAVKPTAALDAEHLYLADGDGTVRAWNRKTLEFDTALTKKLNGDGLLAIARDGETLWGFDGTRAFTWDPNGARWDLVKGKPPGKPCTAFAVVGGKPVGTCGPGVHRFTDGKYWDAPEFKDQISGRGFGDAPHAVASSGDVLAIGTGFGEWGGHLWLLDVSTGTWSKFYDSLGNAVGIAKTDKGWLVAWSMSHVRATTRVHRPGEVRARAQRSGRVAGHRRVPAARWRAVRHRAQLGSAARRWQWEERVTGRSSRGEARRRQVTHFAPTKN